MHRRPLGRGRRLAAIAALVIVVGCLLPWWQFGGGDGLPSRTGNAFEGSGILVILTALATIFLVALPYASDRPVAIDRAFSYIAILVVGTLGLVLRVVDLAGIGAVSLPDRAPGLWLAGLGLILLARAAYEVARESSVR